MVYNLILRWKPRLTYEKKIFTFWSHCGPVEEGVPSNAVVRKTLERKRVHQYDLFTFWLICQPCLWTRYLSIYISGLKIGNLSVLSSSSWISSVLSVGWSVFLHSAGIRPAHRPQDDRGVQDHSLRWGLSIKYADIHVLHVCLIWWHCKCSEQHANATTRQIKPK